MVENEPEIRPGLNVVCALQPADVFYKVPGVDAVRFGPIRVKQIRQNVRAVVGLRRSCELVRLASQSGGKVAVQCRGDYAVPACGESFAVIEQQRSIVKAGELLRPQCA